MPDNYERPTYDLAEIQRLIQAGGRSYRIEPIAGAGAGRMRLDEQDIVDCVLGLDARRRRDGGDFYKSMESRTRPGLYHDVYKTRYCGRRVYCKLQLMLTSSTIAVVIQFKKDESP
jgi:hypothetical protein